MNEADSTFTQPINVRTSDVAALLNVWRDELQLGLVTEKDMEARVDGLRFIDAHHQAWCPGFTTGRWYYYDAGKWVPAEPPPELECVGGSGLLAAITLQLGALTEICPNPQCGQPVDAGMKFCTKCGTRITQGPSEVPPVSRTERRCPTCNRIVPAGKKFCTYDGTRVV